MMCEPAWPSLPKISSAKWLCCCRNTTAESHRAGKTTTSKNYLRPGWHATMDDKQITATITRLRNRAEQTTNKAMPAGADKILPSPKDPSAVARQFLEDHFTHDGMPTLRHWRSGWWVWRSTHWKEVENSAIRSRLYAYTEHA